MKKYFDRNTRTITSINKECLEGRLFADHSYQRRKVWNEQDKVRLIETILLGLIIPEVFFWTADINPENGEAVTHIVDGQQRISAIVDYIADDFPLTEKYLLSETIREQCGKKRFSELDAESKRKIWEYHVSIVDIDSSCTKNEIKEMFYRLNLTNYTLNMQEKRNSMDSAFGDKSEALLDYDFWKNTKLFSATDARRMKDVEYCCSIYILANEGIVDQTNGKIINHYYDDYKDEFDTDNELTNRIVRAMGIIEDLLDKTTISFISKKAQMYTLFSVVFKMLENGDSFEAFFEKIKAFISAYTCFRNEFVLDFDDENMAAVFENVKKYKLASSEGINKVGNRTIRYEVLYKMCTENPDKTMALLGKLTDRMGTMLEDKKRQKDVLEADDLVDEKLL